MPLLQLGGIARLDYLPFSNVGQHFLLSYFRGTVAPMVRGATAIAAVCRKKKNLSEARAECNITRFVRDNGMGIGL